MASVWENAQVEGGDLLVLLALADHSSDDGVCFPSVGRLAKRARLSDRAVQYSLRKLESLGVIKVARGAGPKGCNLFTLQNLHPANTAPVQSVQGANTDRGGANDDQKGCSPLHPNHKESSRKRHSSSRVRKTNREVDERHTPFRQEFERVYEATHGIAPPWNGQEAKMLSTMLAAIPRMTLEHWERIVRNRFASEDASGEALSSWVKDAQRWYKAPLDRFGNPSGGSNGAYQQPTKQQAIKQRNIAAFQATDPYALRIAADRAAQDVDDRFVSESGRGQGNPRLLDGGLD